jgi:hypothetical protein
MQNRHQQNIENLNEHLKSEATATQSLSTTAYVDEVNRYLARIRQQPAAPISQQY